MLHITPWNLMLMLHIRQSIYLVLTNVLSTSFLMFHIIFNKISTKLYNSGNFRFTRYMWSNTCSYFGIAFLLFFMKIENTVYTSFQNSTLLFINGLIFDIMNIQNNHSLESEWIPMIVSLRSVNDWRFFHGCVIFSLSLSKIRWIQFSNAKEPLRKMMVRKCSCRGKYMKDWKEELKLPSFFFDFRLSMYWTRLSRSSRKLVW